MWLWGAHLPSLGFGEESPLNGRTGINSEVAGAFSPSGKGSYPNGSHVAQTWKLSPFKNMTPNLRVNLWSGSNYTGLPGPLGEILRLTPRGLPGCQLGVAHRPGPQLRRIHGSQQEGTSLGTGSSWVHAHVLNSSGQITHSGSWSHWDAEL